VLPVKVDLAVREEMDNLHREVTAGLGGVDILVHSVQYMGPGYREMFMNTTFEQIEAQLRVNLLSAMYATQLFVPHMIKQGRGLVVVLTSGVATSDNANMPGNGSTGITYPVTKAGMDRFVRGVAKELRPHNIAITAVNPGFTLAEHVLEQTRDARYFGWDVNSAHGMEAPARTVREICLADDHMAYTGQVIQADEFARVRRLVPA
jgi:NAD(P)-dependent dehydrogenase (short-subunit alcohol dehydrogenase family)